MHLTPLQKLSAYNHPVTIHYQARTQFESEICIHSNIYWVWYDFKNDVIYSAPTGYCVTKLIVVSSISWWLCQDCSIFSAQVTEILQLYTKSSTWERVFFWPCRTRQDYIECCFASARQGPDWLYFGKYCTKWLYLNTFQRYSNTIFMWPF